MSSRNIEVDLILLFSLCISYLYILKIIFCCLLRCILNINKQFKKNNVEATRLHQVNWLKVYKVIININIRILCLFYMVCMTVCIQVVYTWVTDINIVLKFIINWYTFILVLFSVLFFKIIINSKIFYCFILLSQLLNQNSLPNLQVSF